MKTTYRKNSCNTEIKLMGIAFAVLLTIALITECIGATVSAEENEALISEKHQNVLWWSSVYECFDGGYVTEKSADEDSAPSSGKDERPQIKFRSAEIFKAIF